jgi:hypothetical protein
VIDTQTPQSPGWWLKRLHTQLLDRRPRFDLLHSYVEGTNGIPITATKATRQAYQRLMRMARTNFAELVIEAPRERINVTGFRAGGDSDALGDRDAWRIWQGNDLDADSMLVHRAALTLGESYAIVGGPDEETGVPVITPEDPRQVIAEYDPARRRKAIAGLKVFADGGVEYAYLYLPGYVVRAARDAAPIGASSSSAAWEWDTGPQPLPQPVVPVVRFSPKPGPACGEFEPHLGILDRINFTVLSRMEVATLQAFRQRAVKGVPLTDQSGAAINYDDIFAADPGALWLLPETAEMWESGQVDLNPIRQAIRDDVQDLAAVTRTPLFYLTPDATNGSAEGASLAREGLVFKTKDRLVQFGESWERVMSLAFMFSGAGAAADMEVLWAPPERYSLAERYDAAAKANAAGVPWRTVMTDILQFSPQQVERMEAERALDQLLSPEVSQPTRITEQATPAQPVTADVAAA